ncbi:hypothetical protein WAE56_20020, partial [Iodobacter sp. LRB]|uniref:hypothetical protein n=1 Tax=Iodobacter sp. LRB TaxID=3127955 RepID=UPI00307DEF9D
LVQPQNWANAAVDETSTGPSLVSASIYIAYDFLVLTLLYCKFFMFCKVFCGEYLQFDDQVMPLRPDFSS